MNTYAQLGENLQQVGGDCPEGWMEMNGPRPEDESSAYYTAQSDGTWTITPETISANRSAAEIEWRRAEMPKAQQNVTAIEYGEEGIPGTAQQWQKYWLALRKWTAENPDFPDSGKRPVAPS